jgi:hypothetical protein
MDISITPLVTSFSLLLSFEDYGHSCIRHPVILSMSTLRPSMEYNHTSVYKSTPSYDTDASVWPQPDDGIPVDCSKTSDGWRTPGLLASVLAPLPLALAPTFDVFIDQQPEHIAALHL